MVSFYIPIDQPGMIFNKKNAIKLILKLNQTNQNITCEFEIQNENLKFKNFENFTINNNLYDKNNSINLKYRLDAQKDLEPEILYFKQYDIVFDGFPATESDQKQIDIKKFFQKYTYFVNMQISDLKLEFSNSNFDKVYLKYGSFVSMQSEIIEHKIHVNYDSITDFEIFEKVFDIYILNDTNSENNHFEAYDNLIEVSFYSFDFDFKFYSLIENITLLLLQNIKNVNLILKSKDLGSYKNYLLKILKYRFFVHIKKQNVSQSQAIFFFFYEAYFKEFQYFKKNVRKRNLLKYKEFIETDVKIIINTYGYWLSKLKIYSDIEQFYLMINSSNNVFFVKGFVILNILKYDERKDKIAKKIGLDNLFLSNVYKCDFNELDDLCTSEYIDEFEKLFTDDILLKFYKSSFHILNNILTQHLKKFELYLYKNKKNNLSGAVFEDEN